MAGQEHELNFERWKAKAKVREWCGGESGQVGDLGSAEAWEALPKYLVGLTLSRTIPSPGSHCSLEPSHGERWRQTTRRQHHGHGPLELAYGPPVKDPGNMLCLNGSSWETLLGKDCEAQGPV